MITVDRLRGLGQAGGDTVDFSGVTPDVAYQVGQAPVNANDVTGNANIWAGALNTVGQLGVAFAPAVRNITTPYATYSSVSPYGTVTSSVPVGSPMGNTLSSLGTGIPSLGGISPVMLLIGAALVMMMMGKMGGH